MYFIRFILYAKCEFIINNILINLLSTDGQTNERRNSISSNVSEKTDSLSSESGNNSRSELEHLVER